MGVQVVAKGVDAEQYATEYAAPVRRGLEAVFFLNTNMEKCARNYAPGKPQGRVIGAPVVSNGYASLKGGVNYIETSVLESVEATFFVIARQVADASNPTGIAMFCGNYATGPTSGISMYCPEVMGTRLAGTAGYGNDDATNINRVASVTPVNLANFGLYSVTVKQGSITTRSHTANLTTTQLETTPRRPAASRVMRIGVGHALTHSGLSDVVLYQYNSVEMTDDERNRTVTDLRAYAARRGIIV